MEHLIQGVYLLLEELVTLLARDYPSVGEAGCPKFSDCRMAIYLFIHQRLSETWLIAFVVAVSSIAHEIDHEIGVETIAIGAGETGNFDACFRIVRVDMHNRNLEAFSQVAGIKRAASFPLRGRKPDLVVGDDMDGAADPIAPHALQIQSLGHDSLSGKCRITMDNYGQNDVRIEVRPPGFVHAGAGRASHSGNDRIDMFEVAWIGGHSDHEVDQAFTGD